MRSRAPPEEPSKVILGRVSFRMVKVNRSSEIGNQKPESKGNCGFHSAGDSIVMDAGTALLQPGAPFLGFQPALFAGSRRLGGAARLVRHRSARDEIDEPLAGVGAVAMLAAMAAHGDDENAILGQALTCKASDARAQLVV